MTPLDHPAAPLLGRGRQDRPLHRCGIGGRARQRTRDSRPRGDSCQARRSGCDSGPMMAILRRRPPAFHSLRERLLPGTFAHRLLDRSAIGMMIAMSPGSGKANSVSRQGGLRTTWPRSRWLARWRPCWWGRWRPMTRKRHGRGRRPRHPDRPSSRRRSSSFAADRNGRDRVSGSRLPEHPVVQWTTPFPGSPGEPLLADGVIYVGDEQGDSSTPSGERRFHPLAVRSGPTRSSRPPPGGARRSTSPRGTASRRFLEKTERSSGTASPWPTRPNRRP